MAEQTGEINKDIADRGKAVVEGAREKVVDPPGPCFEAIGERGLEIPQIGRAHV